MKNLEETQNQITTAMMQIANIIKSNEMSALCILYKKEGPIVATPAIIAGSSIDLASAMVQVMLKSTEARNMILAACDCYEHQESKNTDTKEIPPYLKEIIENLLKGL
jgi:hypothetical protein